MYIKRVLRVLIPGVTVSVSDSRIFVSRVPVSGDYSYPLEHCNALGEPKSLQSVIKVDHLANNKVIIIIDHEILGQTLKIEIALLVLGISGTNISNVRF